MLNERRKYDFVFNMFTKILFIHKCIRFFLLLCFFPPRNVIIYGFRSVNHDDSDVRMIFCRPLINDL